MPFKSDKQRRFLWSQKPEVARQIAYKQEGGLLDGLQRPEINNLEDLERVANARNQELAAVAQELGIDLNQVADTRGSSADQANDIARQIWGDNAPQLRESTGAGESANEMAAVMAELARQNPGWGGKAPPNPNQLQPAEQQGFWSWAAEQAGEAAGGAGEAFQGAIDYATGAGQREADAEAYKQDLENMSAEQLLERLNQRAAQPAPEDVRGKSIWDKAGDALGALNPISDANASSRNVAAGAALAGIPNPHLRSAGFGTQLAGAEGLLGGAGGSGAVAPSRNEALQFDLGRAQDAGARQVYNKGFFGGGSWGQETPEQIAQRQQEGARAFEQKTGFQAPEQGTFLDQQFQHQVSGGDDNSGWRSQDRDYWGGGAGSIDMDRTVTTADGNLANAATAQGDASIQALLDDPSAGWGGGHYDDVGSDDGDDWDDGGGYHEEAYGGSSWDSGDDDWDDDVSTGGGWDYDDEEEAIGFDEPSGGGDDSGGGGGGK